MSDKTERRMNERIDGVTSVRSNVEVLAMFLHPRGVRTLAPPPVTTHTGDMIGTPACSKPAKQIPVLLV